MPPGDRGSLKAAFAGFKKPADEEAERKLLGRPVAEPIEETPASAQPAVAPLLSAATVVSAATAPPTLDPTPPLQLPTSYHIATSIAPGLTPRPLIQREAVRQLSFRCPISIASELRRKAAFNQLEQQQIIVEGFRRVLADLPSPPVGWDETSA
jgi:hypothetical protein